MVFIRFQYHLQRHFVVLAAARLVVDITIMQAPIATRRFVFIPMDLQDLSVGLLQVPNKQWGFANNTGRPYITFPFKFSNVFTAISCICHNGSPSEANTVYNVSISGMNIGASGGGSGKYWCAFGVAQQQWGKYTNSGNDRVITYPIAFSELYYANVISPDNCETFVYGISNTNINYRLCNGYNDDRWNGTQTSRLFAVGR